MSRLREYLDGEERVDKTTERIRLAIYSRCRELACPWLADRMWHDWSEKTEAVSCRPDTDEAIAEFCAWLNADSASTLTSEGSE